MRQSLPSLRATLLLALTCTHAFAAPTGGVITGGIGGITTSGATTTVTQSSGRLSLNWATFDIGSGETVRFDQPSASAIAVNRITDVNGSRIHGRLQANGQIFLINPNGILFGSTAQVNVGGLVASTLDVADADLSAPIRRFSGTGSSGVTNQGAITAAQGGYVALLGGTVINTGPISASGGTVALGAGNRIALDFAGDRLLSLAVEENAVLAQAANGGLIQANGGQVLLTAGARDSLVASVVNNTGVIEARTVENRDGRIILLGGMSAGTTTVAGTLDASAPHGGNGGFIETSATRVQVGNSTRITTAASAGLTGTWLIDPQDFTIAASGGDITGATLATQLADNNVAIESVTGATSGNGDIFVNDTVSWSANKLTLSAQRDIAINADLNASAGASLALLYGRGAAASGNTSDYTIAGGVKVNLPAGQNFSTQRGSDGALNVYTVITGLGAEGSTTATDLQGISGNTMANYALGADIDASATATWNGGLGYAPVGTADGGFPGLFSGLGHTISGLTIERPSAQYVGLFGYKPGGVVRDVGLVNVSIHGLDDVGGLVGYNVGGTISNVYATGSVSGGGVSVGGLVGRTAQGTIKNAYATGSVSGHEYLGGLVGFSDYGTISNAYATGSVSGVRYVGGLVGYNNSGTISNAYASGSASGTSQLGGLVGFNLYGTISNAYATGSVLGAFGSYLVGGLVGYNYSGTISNAYATGSVSGGVSSYLMGGLVGYNYSGTISNAYATGSVSGGVGSHQLGGLVGYHVGTITAGYWDMIATGQNVGVGVGDASGVTGLTTAQFQDTAGFIASAGAAGWNFASTWAPPSAGHYPELYALTPVVYAQVEDANQVYGDATPVFASMNHGGPANYVFGMAGDELNPISLTTSATSESSVGEYAITSTSASATSTHGVGYRIVAADGTLAITARPVTVTADDQTKVYGETNPGLTYAVTTGSLVNDDTFTGTLTTVANATSGVGDYDITQGTLDNANYAITFIDGALAITARPVTVMADNQTKVSGEANPELTYSLTTGDLVNDDTFTGALTTLADATSAAGLYGITQGDLTLGSNYEVTFIDGVIEVTASFSAPELSGAVSAATHMSTTGNLDSSFQLSAPFSPAAGWESASPKLNRSGKRGHGTMDLKFFPLPLPATLETAGL